MSTHNICFHGEIRKILCGYLLLSVAMSPYTEGNIYSRNKVCKLSLGVIMVIFFYTSVEILSRICPWHKCYPIIIKILCHMF